MCQINALKSPDWNEVNYLWSWALLKKNIVFLKCIIDLIQLKNPIKMVPPK